MFVHRSLLKPLLCSAMAAQPCFGHATTVSVSVNDSVGKPLPSAVVTLEPLGARAAVKPMVNVDIAQRQKQFVPRVTVVTVGTSVSFPNFDKVRHHVYSFSPAKPFELKLYSGTPSTPVVFDKPGVATLGCNIHDRMSAWVVVVDTPFHAQANADGAARFADVPPGRYKVHAWHPGLSEGTAPTATELTVGHDDTSTRAVLPIATNPLIDP